MRRKLFSVNEVTTRRKLFSSTPVATSRRKLFSNDESNLPPIPENEKKVIKCMDCGKTYEYVGSNTAPLCTKCGSDRFEFITNISNPDDINEGDLNPIDKAFSEKRRKLFNEMSEVETNAMNMPPLDKTTNSLTSDSDVSKLPYLHVCPDCGTEFHTEENYVDYATCPNCGGKRCRKNINGEVENSEVEENSYSETEDELNELLTKYKGRSVNTEDLIAELHARNIYDEVGGIEGLVESGYANEVSEDQVSFSDMADVQYRMFSKLVISVTKEFDIDPVIDRESAIDSLAERFPGKPIMILKKSRHMMAPEAVTFSDKSYLKDSGIESDIRVAYGGQTMAIKDFMNLLSEEYPDAPEDIIDLLESSKAIKVNGGKVLISK